MMKRRSILGAAVVAALAFPAVAEARAVDLRLAAQGGGMYGWGTTTNTPDFFEQTRGPGFGFEVGAKLLVFDFSVDFMQFVNNGLQGTLIQLLAGTEVDIPAGQAKLPSGQSAHILHMGVAAGGALGTGAPVTLPVTNDQLADKGFVSRFRIGYEYFLNQFMGIGAELDLGYHYFLGGQAVAVNAADHSSGYHGMLLANFTFHLGY
jgi:hypothetical protein